MLEGLDDIPWGQLTHAYGAADDVPSQLRKLASPDASMCEEAMYELYGNLWHQGTVYQATAHAVPFLIELLQSSHVVCKPAILDYLQSLATGGSYLDTHFDMYGPAEQSDPDFKQKMKEELEHVRNAREAVVAGSDLYLQLLDDNDVQVRRSATVVLSRCGNHPGVVDQLCTKLNTETDELTRASAAWTVCMFAHGQDNELLELLRNVFNNKKEADVVRATASFALLRADAYVDDMLAELASMLPAIDERLHGLSMMYISGQGDEFMAQAASWMQGQPLKQVKWFTLLLAHEVASVRESATWHAEEVCRASRSATRALLPVIARCLADPEKKVRNRTADLLGTLGQDAPAAAAEILSDKDRTVRVIEADVRKHRQEMEEHLQRAAKMVKRSRKSTTDLLAGIVAIENSKMWSDFSDISKSVAVLSARKDDADLTVPVLSKLIDHDDQWVRIHVIRALWVLKGDPNLILPALERELICRPTGFLALDLLEQMGVTAAPLAQKLRQMINQNERLPEIGTIDSWVAEDEFFVEAAERALAQMDDG